MPNPLETFRTIVRIFIAVIGTTMLAATVASGVLAQDLLPPDTLPDLLPPPHKIVVLRCTGETTRDYIKKGQRDREVYAYSQKILLDFGWHTLRVGGTLYSNVTITDDVIEVDLSSKYEHIAVKINRSDGSFIDFGKHTFKDTDDPTEEVSFLTSGICKKSDEPEHEF